MARETVARALARARAFPKLPHGAWLFGGSVGAAYNDNSAALHRWVRRHHPDIPAFWVINRDSPDLDKAAAVGPVLFREVLRTDIVAARAAVMVVSHGLHDVPMCGSNRSGVIRVRLGHGLTALKTTKPPPMRSLRGTHGRWDLVPVASEFEKQNKLSWHIPHTAIKICGLPRFDDLLRLSAQHSTHTGRRLLYMPTWRAWLPKRRSDLERTDFFAHVRAFLAHPALNGLLARNNAHLDVYLHRLLHQSVRSAMNGLHGGERVHLLPMNIDLQAKLATSDALITDYSGVTWDMLYRNRPVFFYTFDVDRYEADRGAYLDLRHDMPGPTFGDAEALIDGLHLAFATDFPLSPAALRWQEKAFAFRDARNSERVFAEIQCLLSAGSTTR